ncbi:MAG: ABC transporter ATP-binding protein [Hydrogenoanaerobacterium sp.]
MLLQMKNITKVYGNGVLANDDISLDLNEGEILAIVGENGAGKSTIMKVLYGLEAPTDGEIIINGQSKHFKNPQDAIHEGIGMVQQNFMLFPPFSVAENVVYTNEPTKHRVFFDRKKAVNEVRELSVKYGLGIDPNTLVKDCPVGLQQRTEILKVLYQNANIIIFDEPSAVLTPQEVVGLLDTIRALAKTGKSIIIITHKLNEVMEIADRIVVMRGGRHIRTLKKTETNTQELSALMVGRQIVDKAVQEKETGETILSVEGLSLQGEDGKPLLNNCSLEVKSGEIVGIAGVSGNGQTELLHIIAGLEKASKGNVILRGKNIADCSVKEIRKQGCAYVPEDRNTMGAATKANLCENALMAHNDEVQFNSHGVLNYKEINKHYTNMLEQYDVKYNSLQQKAGELSGGNLQKLIVAREISQNAPFLIVSEPTRGVDIGAMEFIHHQILEQREAGVAVLLVSSDLTEILRLSDRIYVMYEGRINGELSRAKATSEELGILMMGGALDGGNS